MDTRTAATTGPLIPQPACASGQRADAARTRILVVTRGDYMTLQALRGILDSGRFDVRVVLVSGDDRTRNGVSMLRALWRTSEWHYFCYELAQFALFAVGGKLFPRLALNVASFARARAIPLLASTKVNSPEVLHFAQAFQPDLLLCVKCPQRLKRPLLALAKHGNLNIHASRLPAYAGRAAHFWAMAQGEIRVGSTVHYMTEAFDDGPILAQRAVAVAPNASAFEVLRALSCAGGEIAEAGIALALQGHPGVPQDLTRRTYYSHPTAAAYRSFQARGYRLMRCSDGVGVIREELSFQRAAAGESGVGSRRRTNALCNTHAR